MTTGQAVVAKSPFTHDLEPFDQGHLLELRTLREPVADVTDRALDDKLPRKFARPISVTIDCKVVAASGSVALVTRFLVFGIIGQTAKDWVGSCPLHAFQQRWPCLQLLSLDLFR